METVRRRTSVHVTADGQVLPVLKLFVQLDAFKVTVWMLLGSVRALLVGLGPYATSQHAIHLVYMALVSKVPRSMRVLCSSFTAAHAMLVGLVQIAVMLSVPQTVSPAVHGALFLEAVIAMPSGTELFAMNVVPVSQDWSAQLLLASLVAKMEVVTYRESVSAILDILVLIATSLQSSTQPILGSPNAPFLTCRSSVNLANQLTVIAPMATPSSKLPLVLVQAITVPRVNGIAALDGKDPNVGPHRVVKAV
jgi:hypothetical protein